jgi:hypothetical protein
MGDSPATPQVWQYVLVWTPGPERSSFQLWAASKAGTRTLWDAWEVAGQVGTPTFQRVLGALYEGAVEAHERSTHKR